LHWAQIDAGDYGRLDKMTIASNIVGGIEIDGHGHYVSAALRHKGGRSHRVMVEGLPLQQIQPGRRRLDISMWDECMHAASAGNTIVRSPPPSAFTPVDQP
jgi:hypothetical protein